MIARLTACGLFDQNSNEPIEARLKWRAPGKIDMPKFTFDYRELLHIFNPFRSKIGPQPVAPVATLTNETNKPIDCKAFVGNQVSQLTTYLNEQQNLPDDIAKLHRILGMQHVILEIGCGDCGLAREIALKNPAWGVIATDKYAWNIPLKDGSHYQKIAVEWKEKRLEAQQAMPDNIVTLRAEADILRFLPNSSLETVLLVNPEPLVGRALLDFISEPALYAKIKPGLRQIVIIPFSREMGVVTCGGYEFDHTEDWSQGLGFIMASGFAFQAAGKVQWGVDLRGASLYSKNSTQSNVYVCGNQRTSSSE
ncbi:hypothetical protein ACFL5W_01535 [Thermodesulfobacteriota bacterium]